ncbi:hypothetical protein GDO86_018289 [Hymenochirus boettgeri]|uniref:Uncharacterized protein n=1 Tax=Hymenochirus boettgeri TaxID=247094 RepID=A0A8T2IDF0_9PIPI|nr:hypothetical protein GDO86_018289 [Hymenochirus boettgeri]
MVTEFCNFSGNFTGIMGKICKKNENFLFIVILRLPTKILLFLKAQILPSTTIPDICRYPTFPVQETPPKLKLHLLEYYTKLKCITTTDS